MTGTGGAPPSADAQVQVQLGTVDLYGRVFFDANDIAIALMDVGQWAAARTVRDMRRKAREGEIAQVVLARPERSEGAQPEEVS